MSLLSVLTDLLQPAAPPDPEVRAATERVIAMVDPVVRAAPGLANHLVHAVGHALGYCEGLVAALPGPVDINRQAFGRDPLVHALFATANDIDAMLGRSQAVRDFLERPECWSSDEFHALLAARRQQKRQFGMAQQGDIIHNDVAQEVLYFSDQTLIEPCCDPSRTRARLRAKALESLLTTFNAHVAQLRLERDSLQADARAEHQQLAGRQSKKADDGPLHRHVAELDRQLRENFEALMPEHLAEALIDFLSHPESALRLTPVVIHVDRLGVVHEATDGDPQIQTLSFPELFTRDRRQHLATLVRISREEALAAVAASRDQQKRYILI